MSDNKQSMIKIAARAKQARELASKATAGEWRMLDLAPAAKPMVILRTEDSNPWAVMHNEIIASGNKIDDAAFIAASRSLVPQLADDVLALIAERNSVCVWQNMGYDADWVTYSTACNDKWAVDSDDIDYTYCPSCGRKIKIG